MRRRIEVLHGTSCYLRRPSTAETNNLEIPLVPSSWSSCQSVVRVISRPKRRVSAPEDHGQHSSPVETATDAIRTISPRLCHAAFANFPHQEPPGCIIRSPIFLRVRSSWCGAQKRTVDDNSSAPLLRAANPTFSGGRGSAAVVLSITISARAKTKTPNDLFFFPC